MENSIQKTVPTYFPLGFGMGKIENGQVIAVEFYDKNRGENNKLTVIGSFALTATKAKELADALQQELAQPTSNDE